MSSQLFKAAPSVFGDGDGLSFLQGANRVLVGGPLDVIDAVGRAGETGLRAVAEGVEAATGLTGIKRDIYGLGQVAGLLAGASPSALPSLKSPSTSTRSGAEKAFKNPPKQKEKAFESPSDFFEIMGDDGAGAEFPQIGKALDDYVYDMNRDGILKALKSDDYPEYQKVLKTNLDRLSSESKIPVSRTENYLDPMAGIEGRRTKRFFDVDKDDILFVGSDAERELIVRGPDGSPMSVRFESPDLPASRPHDDLNTSELLTSYIISPTRNPESKSGVTRQELVNRLSSDANAQTKTQKALDELGYKDTVPVFRTVILKDGKAMDPETITSVSLRPKAFADTNSFLTQGKIRFGDNVIAVRYDVPRDKFIGYFPALADDIKSSVNKKIKEKGIGQTEIEGFETVTNPSEYAKNLIEMQDEAIVDVSGLTAKPLKMFDKDEIQSMISMNSSLARKVASQELKSGPEVRAALGESYTAANPFKFKGTKEEFEQLNQEAAQKMFDNYERFFRGNYKQGGIVYNPFKAGIGAL